jgi:pyrroline-5-carboxylate reductase
MKTKTLGFIGGGRITKIILQAYQNQNITFERIVVTDTNQEVLNSLKKKFSNIIITDNMQEVVNNEVVFVALHPPVFMETLGKVKEMLNKNSILVSLAPKLTIEKMNFVLPGFSNIARMNPSASAIVNKGVNPIVFAKEMTNETQNQLLDLMKPLGSVPVVDESKIEAYAVISAMGHTYYFFQLNKLKELAVSYGMDEKEAQTAITEMLWGTTETLFNSGMAYNEVADLVPVKPMGEVEETIKGYYDQYLNGIFAKIKP